MVVILACCNYSSILGGGDVGFILTTINPTLKAARRAIGYWIILGNKKAILSPGFKPLS